MKYIMLNDIEIIVFPGFMLHADVASAHGIERVTSAGFVDIDNRLCYGESTSLGLKSKQRDSAVLKATLDNCHCAKPPAADARPATGLEVR